MPVGLPRGYYYIFFKNIGLSSELLNLKIIQKVFSISFIYQFQ